MGGINMLNALLKSEIDDIDTTETGFKVTDINSANWCFRKIRALNEEILQNKKLADSERERIDKWEKSESESAKNSIEYFNGLLTEYFLKLREQDPKAKVSTPYGKISSRKNCKWVYINEQDLIKYLKENDKQLIRIKEEIDKAQLKKKYKNGVNMDTGEVLPGVAVSNEENISIKVE